MDILTSDFGGGSYVLPIGRVVAIFLLFTVLFECARSASFLLNVQLADSKKMDRCSQMLEEYLDRAKKGERLRAPKHRKRIPQQPRCGKSVERYQKRLRNWLWGELGILNNWVANLAGALKLLSYIAIFPAIVFLILLMFADALGLSDAFFGDKRYETAAITQYVGVVVLQGLLLDLGDAIKLQSPIADGVVATPLIILEQTIRSILTFGAPGIYGYLRLAAFHRRNVDKFEAKIAEIVRVEAASCSKEHESHAVAPLTSLTGRLIRALDFRIPDEHLGFVANFSR